MKDWEAIVVKLANKDTTMKEISEQVPVSYSSVAKFIKKNNITVKSDVSKDWHAIVKENASSKTVSELSEMTGQTELNIRSYLYRYDIIAKPKFDPQDKQQWQRRAASLAKEYSATEISTILNIPVNTIRYFFKTKNITPKIKSRHSKWHDAVPYLSNYYTKKELSILLNKSSAQINEIFNEYSVKSKPTKIHRLGTFTVNSPYNSELTNKENVKNMYFAGMSDTSMMEFLNLSRQRIAQIRLGLDLNLNSKERYIKLLTLRKSEIAEELIYHSINDVCNKYSISKGTLKIIIPDAPKQKNVTKDAEFWSILAKQYNVYEIADILEIKYLSVRSTLGKYKISPQKAKNIRVGQHGRLKDKYFGKTIDELFELGKNHNMKEITQIIGNSSENSIRAAYNRLNIPFKSAIQRRH